MAEASSSRHEPKVLRRPTPKPDDYVLLPTTTTATTTRPRPLSAVSTGSFSKREGWYEQQRSGGGDNHRSSGSSHRTHQTAYRNQRDDFDLTAPSQPSPIGTPRIERHPSLDASQRRSSTRRSSTPKRSSRSGQQQQQSSSDALTAHAPHQHGTDDGDRRHVGHAESGQDNEGDASRPSTGKWLRSGSRQDMTAGPSQRGLNEVAAPIPVQSADDAGGWVHQTHLEDEEDEEASHDDSQQSALPPPPFGRKSDFDAAQPPVSDLATTIYIYSHLIFFSIMGTLARLGIQWLTFYPGAPLVTPVTWANVAGCLFMGFLSQDRRVFRDEWGLLSNDYATREKYLERERADEEAARKNHAKVKKTIPLYIGLATAFCGSLTSFSSFQRDVFLALSNNLPTPDNHPYAGIVAPSFTSTVHRNGGYSFMALLAAILVTVALSLSALLFGSHVALALDPWTPTLPFRFTRKFLDRAMVLLGPGCWLGAIFLAIWPPDRPNGPSSRGTWANEVWRGEVLFALVFAPVGCILRYYASLKLNGISIAFPLGTFAVNIFGCAVEATCYDIQHVPISSVGGGLIGGGRVSCQVLQGIMDGFCGCLTTVSTWVAELQSLRRRHAYLYGLTSLVVGLGVMIIVMGSVRWTVGWSETACVTMRTSM